MKNLDYFGVTELSQEDFVKINGGGPFFRDLGYSIGLIVGWVENAGGWLCDKATQPGDSYMDMSQLNQVMLFQ